ncbi:hypothetical protein MRX96_054900 [Rhipicephalus microplus]
MGETALRYLVAWKFFTHLVRFTEPYIFLDNRTESDACFEHVTQVMSLAVISPLLQSEPYPDAPLDLDALFPTWIKALGLSSQYMWMDTTTLLYDETAVGPYYDGDVNRITVPTASMLRPFMYMYGVPAVNYGGLGTMIGQALMGALDPRGIHSLHGYVPDPRDEVMREYTKRALCLRKSRRSVEYREFKFSPNTSVFASVCKVYTLKRRRTACN